MKIFYCKTLPTGKSQHSLAYLLLEQVIGREYPELSVRRPFHYGISRYGKPYLEDASFVYFNISHCPVGIAVSLGTGEVGVDMEKRFPWKESLAKRICHKEELKLLMQLSETEKKDGINLLWSWKESYLKYVGTGIRSDLRQLDFSGLLSGFQRDGQTEADRMQEQQREDLFFYSIQKTDFTLACCSREKNTEIVEAEFVFETEQKKEKFILAKNVTL